MADARLNTAKLKRRSRKLATPQFTVDDLCDGKVSRADFERMIEEAITLLDLLDHDPDLEETGDLEPSLGAYVGGSPELELDASDNEPSLGSLDRALNQERWGDHARGWFPSSDLELDRSDSEPCLGSPGGNGNQEHWAQGKDAEWNGDERDYSGSSPTEDDPIFPTKLRAREVRLECR